MLYSFFWVIPQRLNFMCQHFGTQKTDYLLAVLPNTVLTTV